MGRWDVGPSGEELGDGESTGPDGLELDRLLADFDRWASDTRIREAAGARSREGWLRRQAEEEATWSALALDLVERAAVVSVLMLSARRHHGRLVGVGPDFLLLVSRASAATFLRRSGVASLRTSPGDEPLPSAAGSRAGRSVDRPLSDVLSGLAADRPRVRIGWSGPLDPVVGELRAVGHDVLSLRLDGSPPTACYVPLDSVSEVSLLGSG